MKSAIAAFVAGDQQRQRARALHWRDGGDEEGPGAHGTVAIIDWLEADGRIPDFIMIGEPTSETMLGDTIKIGRRGSVNMWIDVPGTQGHVAYPHKAANPIPALGRIVAALGAIHLDDGNDAFPPSNLEFTDVSAEPGAPNVIPGGASARLNIRFNNLQRGPDLVTMVEEIVAREAPGATVRALISGEAFLTPPGLLYDLVVSAIATEMGIEPALSTGGGTSDGRFLIQLCPVVDFGLPNATMHKLDECAAVDDIRALSRIYARVIGKAFI
jgi:succinyl-diaminopimelate desuccinylase